MAIPLPIFQFWSIRKFSEFDPMIKLWFKLTAAHPNWFFGRPISKFGLSRGKFCPRLAVGEISNFGHPISKLLPLLLLGWSQMRNFQIYQIWMAIFQIWSTTMSVLFGLFHFDAPIPKNWAEHTKLTVQSPKSNGISFKFGVNWSEMFQIGREMGKKLEIDHPISKTKWNSVPKWLKSVQNIQNWQGNWQGIGNWPPHLQNQVKFRPKFG